MIFYKELQLNQKRSKELIRNSQTTKEKLYHIAVYLFKIAIVVAFCFLFITLFSILFWDENSIVGVVVLLCIMVSIQAHFEIHAGQPTVLLRYFSLI